MTTNMSNSNHLNGHNGHQSSGGASVIEPSLIQAMAISYVQPYPTLPAQLYRQLQPYQGQDSRRFLILPVYRQMGLQYWADCLVLPILE